MKVNIIGAGIGGLTTAIALEKKGFELTIYEQASSLKSVGAGIILASNAMQVFRHLGIYELMIQNGRPLKSMNITDAQLNPISKVNLDYFHRKYDLQSVSIHRGKLQEVLLAQLKQTTIKLGFHLSKIFPQANGVQLVFDNGKEIFSDLTIGADGIHSNVRKSFFPKSKLRSTNQICWRGVTNFELPKTYQYELNEAWSREGRFAFVPIGENIIYWYVVKSTNTTQAKNQSTQIQNNIGTFPSIVKEIILSTPKNSIHTSVMEDLKPIPQWYASHVCLLGDAAHATTPNMGQGACQAIVDAYYLSIFLEQNNGSDAFALFQKQRKAKVNEVVKQSWQIGKISHWSNPLAVGFRNMMMKLFPTQIQMMQMEKLLQLKELSLL